MNSLPEYTLLIVDDSAEDRMLYRRFLQSDSAVGYRLVEFDSGEAALAWCQTTRPDVILLDYLLPGADGLEILHGLRQHDNPDGLGEWLPLPVVMLTGQGDTGVAVQAMKHGAQDYLVKDTLTPDLLCRTVRHVIDRIQLLGQLRQQQEQQRRSDETLRLALEFAQLGCWDWDLRSNQMQWSDYQYRLLGLEPGSVEPSNDLWSDRTHPDDKPYVEQAIAIALGTQSPYNQEYRVVWDDGSVHWVASRGQTLNDANGKPIRMLGVLIDIHDRKLAELELAQLNAALEERVVTRTAELQAALRDRERQEQILQQAKEAAEAANQSKSLFLANMSHELRTPLNIILGFTQLLNRDRRLSIDQHESIQTMHRSGEHLLSLINDILALSQMEAGQITLEETHFDLRELLQSLELILRHRSHAKGLKFEIEIAEAVPRYIAADIAKLRQILINLLGNAIKFTSHGSISLKVTVDNSQSLPQPAASHLDRTLGLDPYPPSPCLPITLYFAVKDTGIGIAPEDLKTIFDAFEQSRAGHSFTEGTGLGLTTCRHFIELMGGTIAVDSTPSQGSTFHVYLPVGHVQWVENATSAAFIPQPDAIATNTEIRFEGISTMPKAWLQALNQAVLNCDEEESKRLIQQIPASQPVLITQLKHLLYNYQFETIRHLLQKQMAIASSID
ncbi:MAG TPA: ATP-binding protein [Chroococcidiopsis sp.]